MIPEFLADANPTFSKCSPDGGGREEENNRIQHRIEGSQAECLCSPGRAIVYHEAHNVGDIVGSKGQSEIEQGSHS